MKQQQILLGFPYGDTPFFNHVGYIYAGSGCYSFFNYLEYDRTNGIAYDAGSDDRNPPTTFRPVLATP